MKLPAMLLGAIPIMLLPNFGQTTQNERQKVRDACIASLSGFPKSEALTPRPAYPTDLTSVTLEYSASGCYGTCPAFTLTISKDIAHFEGYAYVRAKGKHMAKVKLEEFEAFLHAWDDGNFYAMRDDYCDIHCPDGTEIIVTDIPRSSITLTAPTFTKRVHECFTTIDGRPETPKPPQQYFELARQLRAFAKAKHWLQAD